MTDLERTLAILREAHTTVPPPGMRVRCGQCGAWFPDRDAARAHWPENCPAEQHTQEDDMVTHNDAVTAERERDAARHVARAREIIGAKAEAGDFDIGSTTVGSLILALEALLGLGTAKPGEGEE
jgi:hypothetical protein